MEERFSSKMNSFKANKPVPQARPVVESKVIKSKSAENRSSSNSGGVNISLGGADNLDNDFMEF